MLRSRSAEVQNGAMYDWNDVAAFLAVAETGSTLAAGRALRVSQTTAARRVAALEAALGAVLFERRAAGYALTPAGERLLGPARDMRVAAERLRDEARAAARQTGGAVRLTTHEIYASTVLLPILRDFHDAQPDVVVELDTSEALVDLGAGAADVALRSTPEPQGAGLVGRRLCDDGWTVYCSRSYAEAHGRPATAAALRRHVFIGGGGDTVWRPYREWLRRNDLESAVVMHHGSASGLLAAVRGGLGLAVLPSFVADLEDDLIRCGPPPPQQARGLWLLTHERVKRSPPVRALVDFLAERLAHRVVLHRAQLGSS